MLNVGVIGIGNAGGQVALLSHKKGFDVIALNSSDRDLDIVRDQIPTLVVGNSKGAGKDRAIAKQFIKTAIQEVAIDHLGPFVKGKEHVFIVSSTGGGTGSGMAPLLRDMLSNIYKNITFHLIGIVPRLTESVAAQHNTMAYAQEILRTNPSYLIYDNGKYENSAALPKINEEIVDHLCAMAGHFQSPTALGTIDEQDMSKIISTPGRIVVGGVRNYTEKENDKLPLLQALVKSIEDGAHAELQSDRRIVRQGLIFDKITERLHSKIDPSLETIVDSFGEAVDGFEHLMTAKEEQPENSTYVILSGLSFPDDRFAKILDRIKASEVTQSEQPNSRLMGSDAVKEGLASIKTVRETASTALAPSPVLAAQEEVEETPVVINDDLLSILDGYDD